MLIDTDELTIGNIVLTVGLMGCLVAAIIYEYRRGIKKKRDELGLEEEAYESSLPIDISEGSIIKTIENGLGYYIIKVKAGLEYDEMKIRSENTKIVYDDKNKLVSHGIGGSFIFNIHLPIGYSIETKEVEHISPLAKYRKGTTDFDS